MEFKSSSMNAEKQNSISKDKTTAIQQSKEVLNYIDWKKCCFVGSKLLDFILFILHPFLLSFLDKDENMRTILNNLRLSISGIKEYSKKQIERLCKCKRQSILDEICNQLNIIHSYLLKEQIQYTLVEDVYSIILKMSDEFSNIFKGCKTIHGFNDFVFVYKLIDNFQNLQLELSEDEVMKIKCLITIYDDEVLGISYGKKGFYEALRIISEESNYKNTFYDHPYKSIFQRDFDRVVDAKKKVDENDDDIENLSELIASYSILLITYLTYIEDRKVVSSHHFH